MFNNQFDIMDYQANRKKVFETITKKMNNAYVSDSELKDAMKAFIDLYASDLKEKTPNLLQQQLIDNRAILAKASIDSIKDADF